VLACLMRAGGEYKYRQSDPYWGNPIIDEPLPQELRRSRLTIRDTYQHDWESKTRQPNLNYRIQISRADLMLIEHARASETSREIALLLADPDLHDGLRGEHRRRRGAHANAAVMLRPVRWGLVEAERLCMLAQVDETTRAGILRVLGPDFDPKRWPQNAIMLVSRVFRGAWEKYHVKPPEARTEGDAVDVYRALIPSAWRKSTLRAFREHESNPELIHELWRKRLLGPEGQAARDFDLV